MNEPVDPRLEALAQRAGQRLRASSEALPGHVRSRLATARHAALAEAGHGTVATRWLARVLGPAGARRGWQRWLPAGALAASVLVAVVLVTGVPGARAPVAGPATATVAMGEDSELMADADGLALAQESDGDFDFYAWAVDAAARDAPAAVGS